MLGRFPLNVPVNVDNFLLRIKSTMDFSFINYPQLEPRHDCFHFLLSNSVKLTLYRIFLCCILGIKCDIFFWLKHIIKAQFLYIVCITVKSEFTLFGNTCTMLLHLHNWKKVFFYKDCVFYHILWWFTPQLLSKNNREFQKCFLSNGRHI